MPRVPNALRDAARLHHAHHGPHEPADHACLCGLNAQPGEACRALGRLAAEASYLRRLAWAMRDYRMALWEVTPGRLEAYLSQHGWQPGREQEGLRAWLPPHLADEPVITVSEGGGHLRPVDHLKDALEALEGYEQRSRFEILAELLPDNDASDVAIPR